MLKTTFLGQKLQFYFFVSSFELWSWPLVPSLTVGWIYEWFSSNLISYPKFERSKLVTPPPQK